MTNTNMSSEFWFLSQLHRFGYQAYITLGNTKAIDIAVKLSTGITITFDVKGKQSFLNGTYRHLPTSGHSPNHFYVFIGLEAQMVSGYIQITNPINPDTKCFIVESPNLVNIAYQSKGKPGTKPSYGFYPLILEYLKSGGISPIQPTGLTNFSTAHGSPINFKNYQKWILTLQDFESRFGSQK